MRPENDFAKAIDKGIWAEVERLDWDAYVRRIEDTYSPVQLLGALLTEAKRRAYWQIQAKQLNDKRNDGLR